MKDMFIWDTINSRSYGISRVAMKLAEERGIVPYEALCIGLSNFDPTPRTFVGIDRYFAANSTVGDTLMHRFNISRERVHVLGIKEKDVPSKTEADAEALFHEVLGPHF